MFTFGVPQDYSIHFLCVLSDQQGLGQVQSGPSSPLSLKVKTLVQAILLSKTLHPILSNSPLPLPTPSHQQGLLILTVISLRFLPVLQISRCIGFSAFLEERPGSGL